jgi:hypothetical protein
MHADVNGAVNILKRYLPEQISVSWSSGCLAQPAVNRFAWRKTRSSASAHEPGSGKHVCRICEQNLQWLSAVAEPDSGILGLAGEDVN